MERSSRKHRDSVHTESTRDHKHRTTKHTDDHRRRSEREKSEDVVKRERSYDRDDVNDTESSVDNRRNHKRKDRGYSDDEDGYNDARDKRKDRRRFEDEREREGRKFEDRVKKEEVDFVDDVDKRSLNGETVVKREPKDEVFGGSSNANGDAPGSHSKASGISRETPLALSHPPSKVSSLSTKHENEGVNSNRSHEVPGKSSTDGNSSAGKSRGISLDALSKAKATLLKRKELAEKMKKIPLLNKGVDSSTERSTPPQPVSASAQASLVGGVPHIAGLTAPKFEAVKRAQELAAKMGFRQDPEFAPLINMFPGQLPPDVIVQPKPAKAPVLRLDALGREVDEHGNVVNIPKLNNLSTLKVNINKQKKDAFQILKPELEVDPDKNPHFDPRMGIDKTKLLRPKKMTFQFVEEGKWSKEAEIVKLKSQFGEAQAREFKAKQAQLAKAKAEPDINPNLIEVSERIITKEKPKDPIPDVEWWDVPLLESDTYGNITEGGLAEDILKKEKITLYVEHPRPIEPPAEPAPPPPQPLKLTQKERKKLRTQRRLATEKNRQEMIRQGLLEPPKPKVKMSNLMRVLGSEAVQDPTRLEIEIRSAAAEREQAHVDRNIARKLTPAERREKKERKLFDDNNTLETIVSVYKINDLSHPQTRFKVDVNAQENRLSGCAVISEGICVVVVEGGGKSIKRYQKLMLKRINWAAALEEEDQDENDDDKPKNECVLVWQGSVAKHSFHRFLVHECRTENAARKVFSDAGVGHYWDLAVNFSDEV
ncbi:putative U4/U6 small nuclear ribonucleoprotein Prp3 [Helianthus annuus]|nr:putative U4/U6 small nuclear ribonucleoprotein Prp3 [Helianthus annuus]KAJ0462675.1 putative U4/U6 small nuclear ribonucleoprotein Prp3 [Helianthus annuus]KAJ0823703.1 putative U4/U6 small nuclear ribonucleoprotein Prp3 [Helianthus annuus]KAJ0838438.1 putative U4/U6 small nuclear ribonucleoprotein Prp3 [Helianthus annuus]